MRRGLFRAAAALAVLVGLVLGTTPGAFAADEVSASLSEVRATDGKVTGVLTLRSTTPAPVAQGSLKATIDGTEYPVTFTQEPAAVRRAMLVIDTSGSMGADGMRTVRSATAAYLKQVPADVLVGVVSFATTAGVDLAPTKDRAAVQRVVNGLRSDGDTSLYAGVLSAVKALGAAGDRSIVLLSDGADTVSKKRARDLKAATAAIKAAGARVDVVQFKTKDPEATSALKGFAATGGGTIVAAENRKAVEAAFSASAKALDSQVQFEITGYTAPAGERAIQLTGVAGGSEFAVTGTVGLAAVASPAPKPGQVAVAPVAPQARAASASWYPALAAGLIGIALFIITGASLAPSLQSRRERRVSSIESYVMGMRTLSRSEGKQHATPLTEQLTAFGEKAMKDRKSTGWLLAQIERADLPFRAGDWFVLNLASVLLGGAIGFVMARGVPLFGILVGGLLGLVLPPMVLKFLATRRANKFERVLPDVLMLVATSLKSGFGLPQALDAVARDAAEPAAKEFSRALAETRIGTDVADALDHAAERMHSKALQWTTMAIRIQRDVGGNLAETLLTTANTLRERESLFRQVRALSAEGRLSAYVLIALPIGMFLYMTVVNYEYISLLWTRTLGLIMIVFGIISLIVGIFWMRRVVKIEV